MTPVKPEKQTERFVTLGGPLPVPHCPQFRSFVLDRLYPVTGFCVVRKQPHCLMIPQVLDYRVYCCSRQFDACPRYQNEGCPEGLNQAQEKTDVCPTSDRTLFDEDRA